MPRSRPPYPEEFRREAVELVRSGRRSLRETAQSLGVSEPTLRKWVRQAESTAGAGRASREEREELRTVAPREPGLREEREILKKAAAFFAKESEEPVRVFRWIAARKAEHSIKAMCRVLGVSRSGITRGRRACRRTVSCATRGCSSGSGRSTRSREGPMALGGSTPSCGWLTGSGWVASGSSG